MFGSENIIRNKYYNWYCNIIQNRLYYISDGYTEKHHIIPKCMGGSNDFSNLIQLTAREHYICHYLLTKFTSGKEYYKVMFAFKAMNMKNNTTCDRYFNSRLYEASKKEFSMACSIKMKEWYIEDDNREKHSLRISESWKNGSRDKQLEFMKCNSPFKDSNIHKKSIDRRTLNGTNIFITNNPMLREETKKKKTEKTSGKNHYLRKKRKFYYKKNKDDNWILIDTINGLESGLIMVGLKLSTYNIMLRNGEDYSPTRGSMKGMYAKRICL